MMAFIVDEAAGPFLESDQKAQRLVVLVGHRVICTVTINVLQLLKTMVEM